MSESSRKPPSILAVHQPHRETRPYKNERPSLLILAVVTIGGTMIGAALGHYAALLYGWIGGTPEGVSAIATVAIAGFTWALMHANASSARLADDTLRHLRESSEQELRAYVFVFQVEVAVGEHFNPLEYLAGYHLVVKNTGRTPAYNVTVALGVAFAPAEADARAFPDQTYPTDGSRAPLGPDSTVTNTTEIVVWTKEQRALLDAGQVPYLHGIIRYEDAFGNEWWTRFRHARNKGSHAFTACANGSDAKRTKYSD